MKKLVLLLVSCCSMMCAFAQSATDNIAPENFSSDLLGNLILGGLNDIRWKAGDDSMISNDILVKAAVQEAGFFADRKKVLIEPGEIGGLVKKYGGTKNADEVGFEDNIMHGKTYYSYQQVATEVIAKLNKSKKFLDVVKNPKFFYAGISAQIDADGKKVYISVALGGLDAFNDGKKLKKQLTVRYTTGKKGMQPYDTKECKACEKFAKDLDDLQQHIYINDGLVYLESNNFKMFKKYFRTAKDGLAVDIIQKAQYPCTGPIIRDNNQLSRGVLLKPIYRDKILKNNEYKEKKTLLYKGVIGKVPKKVSAKLPSDGYELNLLYIANKHVCKTIIRKYIESDSEEAFNPLGILPDTAYVTDPAHYNPVSDNQVVEFTIPYEQGKSNYNQNDIVGFVKALNEPAFSINGISIIGHSSLEGDSMTNANLQRKRAQAIIAAMESYANKKLDAGVEKIETSDSWDLFQQQVKGTEFKDMADENKADVVKKLNTDAALRQKLEPILAKERFAAISMTVTYDVKTVGEENFVYGQYKKYLDKHKPTEALKAQKFIIYKIVTGKYDYKRLLAISVPNEAAFASLLVNLEFVSNHVNEDDSISAATQKKFTAMATMAPGNDYATYNKVMCDVILTPFTDDKSIAEEQKKIDGLYSGKAPQKLLDVLNLEHQLKVIERNDTAADPTKNSDAQVQKAIDKIKKIFNINGSDWKNNLKLAHIFVRHGDLAFAMKLLEPYVGDPAVDENLLFTYISIASHNPDNVFSRSFRQALSLAASKNPARYCKLFGAPHLSFQVKENPLIRKQACDICGDTNSPK